MAKLNEDAVNKAADVAGKNAKALSEGMQFAIVTCLPNIANGAFWGFVSMADVQKHADVIKGDQNLIARKLKRDCIIEVSPDYIMKAAVSALPGVINESDLNNMKKAMAEAEAEFVKFLIKKGKEGNFSGRIGIYCINDTTKILYKGTAYPAFRLPASKVLELLNNFGYRIKVGEAFVSAKEAYQMGATLFNSFELSPTKTGVFCEICSTYTPEQIAQIETAIKGRK